jgi:hypothetical protein
MDLNKKMNTQQAPASSLGAQFEGVRWHGPSAVQWAVGWGWAVLLGAVR